VAVDLDNIVKSLLAATGKLSPKDRSRLQDLVTKGNTLIEVLAFLVQTESPRLRSLLDPVIDEIFVDFHVAITLAMAGQFKSACVLLRTCLEEALYVLYFVDHPVEAYLWANHSEDVSFSKILNIVADRRYFHAANGRYPPQGIIEGITKRLLDLYRSLSERVHGKYLFLQVVAADNKSLLSSFINLAESFTRDLTRLSAFRSSNVEQLRAEVPNTERLL
jgi:hypothetical protein